MIYSFRHKGLEKFFTTGSTAGIQVAHARKLSLILARLHDAVDIKDMDFPGSGLHPLKGDLQGYWSVRVNGNWRIIFRFEDGEAELVDYVDYH